SGDAVLVHLADTLRACVRDNDFIARIGGDEFVIVVSSQPQAELERIAQRILSATATPASIEGESVQISVSVGVANDNKGCLSLNQMMKFADLALYRAKHNGRGRYEQFTSSIQQEHDAQRKQRDEFRHAIESGQFFPVYQPQFDAETLEIIGVEALARWNHPQRGVLTPGDFLEVAIAERRLVDLDRAILHAAMNDAKGMASVGMCMPALSINVSPQSLATRDFLDVIKKMQPFPASVCFELVETMLLDEPSGVVTENLDGLRKLGVSLDIDDFGSGHASILGMLEAQPDRVKIDQRLIIPMLTSQKHQGLVKSIIQIADSLGMDTVAEGVESHEHRAKLREMGCRSLQGFGFARPMPLNDLIDLLNKKAA
ncbi:MAG: bifunctional diguanylate cyclase/phosphodiesterase, partial [Pseudomonadota bacterium]